MLEEIRWRRISKRERPQQIAKDQLEQHRLQGTNQLERVRSAKIKLVGRMPGMRKREKKRLQQMKERKLLMKSKNKN